MAADCVLVYPEANPESPTRWIALSIFYLGALLEQNGFEVEYADERHDGRKKTVDLLEKNPMCTGVSSMTGFQLKETVAIFKKTKEINPEIYTILGGVHGSLLPDQCIKESFVDFVIVGEGEKTLLELVTQLKGDNDFASIDGLVWKKDGKIIRNNPRALMNLAELPFPYSPKMKRYYRIAAKSGQINFPTSRGCPHCCTFCYNTTFNNRRWRPVPLDKYEKELNILASEFKFKHMIIGDDNIGADLKRVSAICQILKKIGVTWYSDIRCDYITEEFAKTIEDGGCTSLFMGVESGSERVLNEVIQKGYRRGLEDVRNCVKIMAKTQISTVYSFMCGLPTETREELSKSVKLANWIRENDRNAQISFYVYTPYPGTQLYQSALESGFKPPRTMEEWSKMSLNRGEDPHLETLYYLSGLRFRENNLQKNFAGWKRAIIFPFQLSAYLRWNFELFGHYWEKPFVRYLFKNASEQNLRKLALIDEEKIS